MTDHTKKLLAELTIKNGLVISCNDTFVDLIGFTEAELKDILLETKLHLLAESEFLNLNNFLEQATSTGIFTDAIMFNSAHYAVNVNLFCIKEDDLVKLYFRVLQNKRFDPISELPNGGALTSRVDYLLEYGNLTMKDMVLILVEVDNFSTINYRYNFIVGDHYLVALGKLLTSAIKDIDFVVRFSNAQYGLLFENHDQLSCDDLFKRIESICQELCLLLDEPLNVGDNIEIIKSFSIGCSAPNVDYDCFHSMGIAAETAMSKSHKFSINKFNIASLSDTDELITRKLIIDALPQSIIQNKIQVYYQPQYDIKDNNKLIGLEALSRWNDELLGNIKPDLFVSIAEDIGLHFEFDLWVFDNVCRQIMDWKNNNVDTPRVAINISIKSLETPRFIERIQVIIDQTLCPTNLLELEVTETTSITNIQLLSDNMLKAKALGIHIAIDDFGTGYSSLYIIRTFCKSFDKLKLDRSLVDKISESHLDKAFTKQVIELGKILNISVLAEGVETKEQLDLLIECGCDYVQGYYFSKALTHQDTAALIQTEAQRY